MAEGVLAPDGVAAFKAPDPGLVEIFTAFTKISLTSFGGGLSGWMMREFVQGRGWLTEDEFLSGLALAQALPGVNVVNLSIWIGYRLRGGAGALAGAVGMIVPAMLVAIAVVAGFRELQRYPVVHLLLPGVAAAAIGLSLQMGIRAGRRVARQAIPAVLMAITFVMLTLLHLPLLLVVAVMAPVGVAHAAWQLRRR